MASRRTINKTRFAFCKWIIGIVTSLGMVVSILAILYSIENFHYGFDHFNAEKDIKESFFKLGMVILLVIILLIAIVFGIFYIGFYGAYKEKRVPTRIFLTIQVLFFVFSLYPILASLDPLFCTVFILFQCVFITIVYSFAEDLKALNGSPDFSVSLSSYERERPASKNGPFV